MARPLRMTGTGNRTSPLQPVGYVKLHLRRDPESPGLILTRAAASSSPAPTVKLPPGFTADCRHNPFTISRWTGCASPRGAAESSHHRHGDIGSWHPPVKRPAKLSIRRGLPHFAARVPVSRRIPVATPRPAASPLSWLCMCRCVQSRRYGASERGGTRARPPVHFKHRRTRGSSRAFALRRVTVQGSSGRV